MLHNSILVIGFVLSLLYTAITYFRVHRTGYHEAERSLSVVFGVSLFGILLFGASGTHGVNNGYVNLLITTQEWLVLIGSLLTCRHINDRHRSEQCSAKIR